MTFQNPIGFVKRKEIPLVIDGQDVTGYKIDLEDLTDLGERYEWFGSMVRGEKVDQGAIPRTEMLKVANAVIALSLAPTATGAQRAEVEASARSIDAAERVDLMRMILSTSFKQLAAPLAASAEGKAPTPPKPNRQQRRAVRSTGGGAKPQT